MNAVGVDVGGTKIAVGVVSPEGELLNEVRRPTADTREQLLSSIAGTIMEVEEGYEVGGVCLAVPGYILARDNKVLGAANLEAIEGISPKEEPGARTRLTGQRRERPRRRGLGRVQVRGWQGGRSPAPRHARDRRSGRRGRFGRRSAKGRPGHDRRYGTDDTVLLSLLASRTRGPLRCRTKGSTRGRGESSAVWEERDGSGKGRPCQREKRAVQASRGVVVVTNPSLDST